MRFDRKIGYRLRNERILPEMLNGYPPEYALNLLLVLQPVPCIQV